MVPFGNSPCVQMIDYLLLCRFVLSFSKFLLLPHILLYCLDTKLSEAIKTDYDAKDSIEPSIFG